MSDNDSEKSSGVPGITHPTTDVSEKEVTNVRIKSAKGHAKNARNQLDVVDNILRTMRDYDDDTLEGHIEYARDEVAKTVEQIDAELEARE